MAAVVAPTNTVDMFDSYALLREVEGAEEHTRGLADFVDGKGHKVHEQDRVSYSISGRRTVQGTVAVVNPHAEGYLEVRLDDGSIAKMNPRAARQVLEMQHMIEASGTDIVDSKGHKVHQHDRVSYSISGRTVHGTVAVVAGYFEVCLDDGSIAKMNSRAARQVLEMRDLEDFVDGKGHDIHQHDRVSYSISGRTIHGIVAVVAGYVEVRLDDGTAAKMNSIAAKQVLQMQHRDLADIVDSKGYKVHQHDRVSYSISGRIVHGTIAVVNAHAKGYLEVHLDDGSIAQMNSFAARQVLEIQHMVEAAETHTQHLGDIVDGKRHEVDPDVSGYQETAEGSESHSGGSGSEGARTP